MVSGEQDTSQTETQVRVMAQAIHLPVPDACLPSVIANTQLLNGYVDLILGFDLPDDCAPAYEYEP